MILSLSGQYLLALIFLVSSVSKCLDVSEFRLSIRQFGILKNNNFIKMSSVLMIIIELSTSFLIIFFFDYVITFVFAMGIMAFFIAILVKVTFEKKEIHCNCFGASNKPTNKLWAITRNMLIMALIVVSWVFRFEDQFSILEKVMMFIIVVNIALFITVIKEKWYRKGRRIQHA